MSGSAAHFPLKNVFFEYFAERMDTKMYAGIRFVFICLLSLLQLSFAPEKRRWAAVQTGCLPYHVHF